MYLVLILHSLSAESVIIKLHICLLVLAGWWLSYSVRCFLFHCHWLGL